jgi:hydrogenase maturation protein HypF
VADASRGVGVPVIASRFHSAVAEMIARVCSVVSRRRGIRTVALSGGVFQNALLLERTLSRLRNAGLEPLIHHQVPCNDAGVSLGQVAVASARYSARRRRRRSDVSGRAR